MTRLWGRTSESATCAQWLADPDVAAVTITGPGGVGKTRLARHVVATFDADPRVAVVVELAGVTDPADVLPAIADVLAVNAGPDVDLVDAIAAATAQTPTLLLLDNLEHLPGSATVVTTLVDRCPRLIVLATSRVPLGFEGERVLALEPLAIADDDPSGDADGPAVGLFLEILADRRVRATAEDHGPIRDICAALGGSPLAIEIAAARCTVLAPVELLAEIRGAGAVETLSGIDARPRDLRTTVEWSLALLDPIARHTIDAIATFNGWATRREIAEVVESSTAATPAMLLDAISTLVTHHLLDTADGPGTRWFRLHPLVREVVGNGLDDAVLRAQDQSAVAFARRADAAVESVDAPAWLEDIARRHEDLTTALQRAVDNGDGATAATLVLGLAPFWVQRGGASRQMGAIDQVLALDGAHAIGSADRSGLLAWRASIRAEWRTPATDVVALGADLSEAVELAIAGDDRRAITRAAMLSARCAPIVGPRDAAAHIDLALARAVAADDEFVVARAQAVAGLLAHQAGDGDRAVSLASSALLAARRLDAPGIAATAAVVLLIEKHTASIGTLAVSVADIRRDAQRAGDRRALAVAHVLRARVNMEQGNLAGTAEACAAAIRLGVAMGHPNVARVAIATLTVAAAATGHLGEAAALHGVNAVHIDGLSVMFPPGGAERYRAIITLLESRMEPTAFSTGVTVGGELQWPDALAMVLTQADAWAAMADGDDPATPNLTGREQDVLRCIAAGMSNKQIAIELAVSPKTAAHHTTNLFRKLDVSSRAAATAWAYRTGVISP